MRQNKALGLMANRLGFNMGLTQKEGIESNKTGVDLEGMTDQSTRLTINGGYSQQERMIFDKRRSFDRALKYSYQAANIKRIQCQEHEDNSFRPNIHAVDPHDICRALINPDKNKMDHDDKILSVHFEENYHTGDIFEWLGTNTYWIIYLQELTEVAYFRGYIRKCEYQIKWQDEKGETHSSYAAVRGPVETKINYIQKHQISVDTPNHSLNILLPRNKDTLDYFKRYSKFYLSSQDEGSPQICWRVEAIDWISTPGILEVDAVEYYSNEFEDDVANGIAGGLIITPPESPNAPEIDATIEGEVFIKPKIKQQYSFTGSGTYIWSIKEKDVPVRLKPEDNQVTVIWDSVYSGQFTLVYGPYEKVIVVESLF